MPATTSPSPRPCPPDPPTGDDAGVATGRRRRTGATARRRSGSALVALLVAATLTGCVERHGLGGDAFGSDRLTTVPSLTYAATVPAATQVERLQRLDEGIAALEADSSPGWKITQDDRTGVGAVLSGGVYRLRAAATPRETIERFVRDHGSLFGLGGDIGVALPDTIAVDAAGVAMVRTVETFAGIPVDGSGFLVPIRRATTRPEISYVDAHVFPDLDVTTTPTIDAAAARAAMTDANVRLREEPFLVIDPSTSTPALEWKADGIYDAPGTTAASSLSPAIGPDERRTPTSNELPNGAAVTVYVDAATGAVVRLTTRATNSFAAQAKQGGPHAMTAEELKLPPPGKPFTLQAEVVGGRKVTINAERLADGRIAFIDSSQPGADRTTGRGLNIVFDGSGLGQDGSLPGELVAADAQHPVESDAITALWAAKYVLDYYRTEHGRRSFDGRAAPLVSTVAVAAVHCNAYFDGHAGQMVYGQPCMEGDKQTTLSMVDIGIVGHEITHGVTAESAPNINQSGQGGALNEGMSDYFGIVMQDRVIGKPIATLGVTVCEGLEGRLCTPFKDGTTGTRNVDTGAIFDDYEFFLREPYGLLDDLFDSGGVHHNSLVWTNALWRIRKRFAAQDGGDPVTSKAAKRFDRVVYRALTTYFTDDTDMAGAAAAVLQSAIDLPDVTTDERGYILDQFLASQLCDACTLPEKLQYDPIAASTTLKHRPSITSKGVIYSEITGSLDSPTIATYLAPFDRSSAPRRLSPKGANAYSPVGRGDWVISAQTVGDTIVWALTNVVTGKTEPIEGAGPPTFTAPAIGRTRAAWMTFDDKDNPVIQTRAIAGGPIATLEPSARPLQIGVDGDLVAYWQADGGVYSWNAAKGGKPKLLYESDSFDPTGLRSFPGQVAVVGTDVFALVPSADADIYRWQVVRLLADGSVQTLSTSAFPAGLSADAKVVVWADTTGIRRGGIAGVLRDALVDSDLVAFNIASENVGSVVRERGQQGFPSIDRGRLAWQDSLAGADDIYGFDLDENF